MPRGPVIFSRETVYQIGKRVGMGVPIKRAVVLMGDVRITVASLQAALQRDKTLLGIFEAAIAEFVDEACSKLAKTRPEWILERAKVHAPDFVRPSANANISMNFDCGLGSLVQSFQKERGGKFISDGEAEAIGRSPEGHAQLNEILAAVRLRIAEKSRPKPPVLDVELTSSD